MDDNRRAEGDPRSFHIISVAPSLTHFTQFGPMTLGSAFPSMRAA
jgi:hypothetical protein